MVSYLTRFPHYLRKLLYFSTTRRLTDYAPTKITKVLLVGAAGKLGKPLTLILKQSRAIDDLALYDVRDMRGLGLDIGHMDTRCCVSIYTGKNEIERAFADANVVVVIAGKRMRGFMTTEKLFYQNCDIIAEMASVCSYVCPKAMFVVATNPVNCLVPVACETMKKHGTFNKNRIFGMMTQDAVRTNTLVAEVLKLPPQKVTVPIIGGHSQKTTIPILSQARPKPILQQNQVVRLTQLITSSPSDVLECKEPATLSVAFSIARFVTNLIKSMSGQKSIMEHAYVPSNLIEGLRYLGSPIELGMNGLQRNFGLPPMTKFEKTLLSRATVTIAQEVLMAEKYVTKSKLTRPPEEEEKRAEEDLNFGVAVPLLESECLVY